MFTQIIAGDILLKPVEGHDAGEIFSLANAIRSYLRRWLPWLDSTQSVKDTAKFIEESRKQHEQKTALVVGIHYDGKIAGVIGFHNFNWPNRLTSMGYWLAENLQARGLMTRSCAALIDFALQELKLNRVEIRCAVGNARSRKIPERLGFHNEGTIRDGEWLNDRFVDLVVYGMLAREWPAVRHAGKSPGV